jgi:hypothetical protein
MGNTKEIQTKDVFYTSWGYDQTNYDYVVVESISPTGKTAVCRRAKYNNLGVSGQCNKQQPIAEGYGKSFRMRIQDSYNKTGKVLRGSYIFCGGEESTSKRMGTFWTVDENKVFYETDSQFGH